ncbi:MAG: hypothetical protein HEQ34_05495 [Sphingorhabdus sp.]|uniref:hypothetical protein n=1 Tax=Sphingorhabdus sp. TaxID=1902408 RepID=UPI0025E9013C|nr:hypothetical protein [Sphingorhabdus sp.]MCO4091397.1 hypothetical protein [Sphingorhabdus sp.]
MPWFSGILAAPLAVQLPSFSTTAMRANGLRAEMETFRIVRALADTRDLRNKLERNYKYI